VKQDSTVKIGAWQIPPAGARLLPMYSIQIVLCDAPGPDGFPSYFLPRKYPTPVHANLAASIELRKLKRPVGSSYFNVFDQRGEPVA